MPYGFNEDKSKFDLSQKADASHTHDAGDITSGEIPAARIGSLPASKITSGTLPIARGGTNAATAAAARTSLGATSRRTITSGNATTNDVMLVANVNASIGSVSANGSKDKNGINIAKTGYIPIALTGLVPLVDGVPSANVVVTRWAMGIGDGDSGPTLNMTVRNLTGSALSNVSVRYSVIYLKAALLNQ